MRGNADIIAKVYAAMAAKDAEVIQLLSDPEITVQQSRELPWGGVYRGLAEAMRFFHLVQDHIESQVTPESLIDAGDQVAVVGKTSGVVRSSGHSFSVPLVHLWTLRDGRVTALTVLLDNPTMTGRFTKGCLKRIVALASTKPKEIHMPVLLHIDSSPQHFTRSISRQLTAAAAKAWQVHHPDGVVQVRDLNKTPLLALGQAWVDGRNLTDAEQTEEQGFALNQSDELVRELLEADVLLLGAPMHNFNVPAVLKLWLDHVIRSERTVRFTSRGMEGLLAVRKAVVVIASGGNYAPESRAHALDYETPYLDFVLRSMGIRNVCFAPAYDTPRPELGRQVLERYLHPLQQNIVSLLVDESPDLCDINEKDLCAASV